MIPTQHRRVQVNGGDGLCAELPFHAALEAIASAHPPRHPPDKDSSCEIGMPMSLSLVFGVLRLRLAVFELVQLHGGQLFDLRHLAPQIRPALGLP